MTKILTFSALALVVSVSTSYAAAPCLASCDPYEWTAAPAPQVPAPAAPVVEEEEKKEQDEQPQALVQQDNGVLDMEIDD